MDARWTRINRPFENGSGERIRSQLPGASPSDIWPTWSWILNRQPSACTKPRPAAPFGGLSLLLVENPPTIPLSDTATTPAKKMMAPTRFGLPLKYSLGGPTTRPLADRLTPSLVKSPIGGLRVMPGAFGLEGGNSELGKQSGPCESRSRHLGINSGSWCLSPLVGVHRKRRCSSRAGVRLEL
jgi:hypothetical protein